MAHRRLLSSLLLILTLGGCAALLTPPRRPVEEDARRVLAALITRWHDFSDLRTLAEIDLTRGGQRDRMTAVLLAQHPGSLRLEALSPLGQPLLVAVVHAGELVAYDATTNEGLTGPATARTAQELLYLPLEAEDLVAVVSGHAVPPRDLRSATLAAPDQHGPSLVLVGPRRQQRIWLDPQSGVVNRHVIQGERYHMVIAYRRAPDGRLAGFELHTEPTYLAAAVRYQEPVINGGVDAERFRLRLPAAAVVRPLR